MAKKEISFTEWGKDDDSDIFLFNAEFKPFAPFLDEMIPGNLKYDAIYIYEDGKEYALYKGSNNKVYVKGKTTVKLDADLIVSESTSYYEFDVKKYIKDKEKSHTKIPFELGRYLIFDMDKL